MWDVSVQLQFPCGVGRFRVSQIRGRRAHPALSSPGTRSADSVFLKPGRPLLSSGPLTLTSPNAHSPVAKLVVPGGNGFIGSEICRVAVQNGHDVAAFGRTGRPALTPARHPWMQEVEWRAADVFAPDTWRDLLDGADAVVHSIATIREAPERNITFDRVNAESVLVAANEAVDAGISAFVFLSVRDKPPLVPYSFLSAKRRADRALQEDYPALRTVSLRPNLVYGARHPGTSTLAAVLVQAQRARLHPYACPEGRPLPVEFVAAAAVQSAVTESVEGILSVPQIEDVGRTCGLVNPEDASQPTALPLLVGLGGTTVAGWLLQKWWSR